MTSPTPPAGWPVLQPPTSDGHARMPTFVQSLLAWLLGLVPSGILELAFVFL